jgi:membrane protein DedA with SNARE-associated domain
MAKVHSWFDRYGTWTLLVGYYIPGVRHVTAVVAGTSGLSPAHFSIFAYTGAVIWSATFIAVGYFFGDHWSQVLEQVNRHVKMVTWTIVIFIALYLIWRVWHFKKRGSK